MENEKSLMINDVNNLTISGNAKVDTYTNLQDKKQIFNLDSKVDFKINDCIGDTICVRGVLIKNISKKMVTPETNEAGVIIKDTEYKRVCILIDNEGKSYVTGSNLFTIQMIKYLQLFGLSEIESENGLLIKIVNKEIKNSSNKALGFELV